MTKSAEVTILVVDDEPDLLSLVSDELGLHGFKVFSALSADDALDILSKRKVDVILSDVRMPGCDGVQMFHKVRSRYKQKIPFLFMTGYPDLSVEQAIKEGACAMITKPFHLNELVSVVKQTIEKEKQ